MDLRLQHAAPLKSIEALKPFTMLFTFTPSHTCTPLLFHPTIYGATCSWAIPSINTDAFEVNVSVFLPEDMLTPRVRDRSTNPSIWILFMTPNFTKLHIFQGGFVSKAASNKAHKVICSNAADSVIPFHFVCLFVLLLLLWRTTQVQMRFELLEKRHTTKILLWTELFCLTGKHQFDTLYKVEDDICSPKRKVYWIFPPQDISSKTELCRLPFFLVWLVISSVPSGIIPHSCCQLFFF